jgi:hypothetical protein
MFALLSIAAAALIPTAFAAPTKTNYTVPYELVKLAPMNPGRETVMIKYGPFTIPGAKEPNAMTQFTGDTGLLYNQPVINFKKPCDDCLVTYLKPGLITLDGKNADTDQGLWLHHMVMFNEGPGRWDATCRDAPISLPHTGVQTSAKKSERMFASGNERTTFSTTLNETVKAGYYLKPTDKMHMIIDLMNLNEPRKDVYVTLTFETLKGDLSEWSSVKPVWLDADNCKMSDINVPADKKVFKVSSKPWKANFEGEVLGMGAHLHNGGTNANILWNGEVACDSEATYEMGGTPERRMVKRDDMMAEHISAMSYCKVNKQMKKDDVFIVDGLYDMEKHPGMVNINNKLSEVMAISVFYVKVPLHAY